MPASSMAKWNSRIALLALAVVGAVMFGIAAVKCGSISAGEWMSFLGSMAGAMVTVAGAVYIIHLQAESESRRYRDALRAILEDAMRHIENCEDPPDLHGQSVAKMQQKHAEMAMKMINVAKSMTSQRAPDTANLARAYMLIAEMDIDIDQIAEDLKPAPPCGHLTDVSEHTRLTKAAVRSAIAQLKL